MLRAAVRLLLLSLFCCLVLAGLKYDEVCHTEGNGTSAFKSTPFPFVTAPVVFQAGLVLGEGQICCSRMVVAL
jgi:hypothetical protein